MSNDEKRAMCYADQSTHIATDVFEKQIQLHTNMNNDNLSTDICTKILSCIGAGEENAVHLCDLMKITGLDNRELRKHIETIRRSGAVIISNQNGYFRPLRQHEVHKYVKQETSRAKSIFYTLKAAMDWGKDGV